MDWATFGYAVLSSTVVGGAISTFLDARSRKTQAREDRHIVNVDAVHDAISELRTRYQQAAESRRDTSGGESVVLTPRHDETDELIALENALDAATAKCGSKKIIEAANAYKEVGRAYAARDPDVGKEPEQRSYQALQDAMLKHSKKFRP